MNKKNKKLPKGKKRRFSAGFFIMMAVLAFALLMLFNMPKSLQKTDCSSTNDRFACYESYYNSLVKKKSVKAAFTDLRNKYEDQYIKSQCHQLIHVIGRAAAKKYPNAGEAFSNGDSFCWSGYYHGVMEGIVSKTDINKLAEEINSICDSVSGKEKYSFDYYNCVHGIGHGIMYIKDNEVPLSLEACNNLKGHWEQSSCWGGVFMENIIANNKNHFTKYLKPDDPLYPCNAVEEKYRKTCYLMQTSYMLQVTGRDFLKVFELCGQVGEQYTDACYQSLGRDASGQSVSDIRQTKNSCLLGKDFRQQSNCIIGAVKDFISYFHSDVEAGELCAALPTELQQVCFDTAKSYYISFQN